MKKTLVITSIVLIFFGILTFKMMNLARVKCSLCISFGLKRHCVEALGVDEKHAVEEAHRTACALLTSGVTDTLSCQRVLPEEVQCAEN